MKPCRPLHGGLRHKAHGQMEHLLLPGKGLRSEACLKIPMQATSAHNRSSNISTDPPLAYLPEVGRQQLCRLFWQNMRPVANRCFADGGGLSHLSAQQRRTWIIAKRQAKADNQPMPTTWPLNQQPTAGGSASSAQTISDLELRLANRDAQIMKISSVYMGSPAHIDEFNTGLLAREWRPL